MSVGSHRDKFLLKSDVARDTARAIVSRDIEAFESKLHESDTDDDEVALSAKFEWSREAGNLYDLLQKKRNWQLANEDNLYAYFKHLSLRRLGIQSVTEEVKRFCNLQELNLSGNDISSITALPGRLTTLHAYDNKLTTMDFCGGVAETLVHLGVGYNQIASLPQCLEGLVALESLDVSYNALTDLPHLVKAASGIPRLSHLIVQGNPLCLLRGYRSTIETALLKLETLDDVKCAREEQPSGYLAHEKKCSIGIRLDQVVLSGIHDPSLEGKEADPEQSNYVLLEVTLPDGNVVSSDLVGPITFEQQQNKKAQEVTHSEDIHLDLNLVSSLHIQPSVLLRDKIDLQGLLLKAVIVSKDETASTTAKETETTRCTFGTLQVSLRQLLEPRCNGQV